MPRKPKQPVTRDELLHALRVAYTLHTALTPIKEVRTARKNLCSYLYDIAHTISTQSALQQDSATHNSNLGYILATIESLNAAIIMLDTGLQLYYGVSS